MSFDIAAFHADAVSTPSHEDVGEMRELLVGTLEGAGLEPEVDDLGNVLASKGSGEPHLVLNTHIDTVAPHVTYERDGNIVRGRGACDAKGPLAALLAAFLRVDPTAGTLTLAITPDEGTLMTGAAGLQDKLSADGYIVGEPTDLDVCIAARGQCEGTITIEGESGHAASVPAERNPVFGLERVLESLRSYDDEAGPGEDDVLGEPKLTPTVLEGGEAPNRIPESCQVTFDRRSVPPETADSFRADLEAYLEKRVSDGSHLEVSVDLIRPDTPFPKAFVTDEDAELVQTLEEASGGDVRPFGAATEAGFFADDAPTVVFGPGVLADDEGGVAHAQREYVRLSEVEEAANVLEATLLELVV
ncbi:M20 family metallopeptidase [Natronobacterium gregoryi]|uniref:Acetylornithine deacetylase/succinyldiaminopimelate desuccinylase-like deacylase n=2 Tax=Natronobacterium gregoryi TaxID=44930 RepID=L0AFK7_NATGS|nr:M20 family metallopeptidase [Natronobacterium gregoryi]AFZ72219.1 acetylornithine deacetylase/succinyldiaminopimelate desuccinylase-like deacylase [Natronobacterium gregoryi SP2]ELY62381.1 succinyl-diaminopimelate desuccinylase [Natronobacterium gregoryi SP2]PLK20168.1 succinyl-diaminopimelate desuccinylase [Natronobacterium gregoryi SP2]SFJ28339.1 acetylornithine deacetylase [Natronobacterium gregoryi]